MLNSPFKKPSNSEIISWIRLFKTENVGKVTFFNLLKIFGNAEEALKNVEKYSLKGGLKKPVKLADEKSALLELENCRKIGAKIITFNMAEYPNLLRQIADPPPIITALGNANLLNQDIISIVGPRNASINGCKFAQKIAFDLGSEKLVIASGMARGIDSAAHLGGIASGTIAVIAGGIDNIYPPENKSLYQQIAEKGLIISENFFGTPPRGVNFSQRNRIISGIALGVVVIEATLKSGTLITARYALEQNRDIFAVPGSPFDPRAQGTNRLIKQGAKLTESAEDILEEINHLRGKALQNIEFREKENAEFQGFDIDIFTDDEVDEARKLIIEKIGYQPVIIGDLISELQIPIRIANIALIQLELAGKIEYKNGKVVMIA